MKVITRKPDGSFYPLIPVVSTNGSFITPMPPIALDKLLADNSQSINVTIWLSTTSYQSNLTSCLSDNYYHLIQLFLLGAITTTTRNNPTYITDESTIRLTALYNDPDGDLEHVRFLDQRHW